MSGPQTVTDTATLAGHRFKIPFLLANPTTVNQRVVGSSPTGGAKGINKLRSIPSENEIA